MSMNYHWPPSQVWLMDIEDFGAVLKVQDMRNKELEKAQRKARKK